MLIKDQKNTFAALLIKILGFKDPLNNHEARVMIKARKFFNEVQVLWTSKLVNAVKEKFKDENASHLATGGICSVFELIDHMIRCLEKNNYFLLEEFVSQVLPDSLSKEEN